MKDLTVERIQQIADDSDVKAKSQRESADFARGRARVYRRAQMMFEHAVDCQSLEWKATPNFDQLPANEKVVWIGMAQMALRMGDLWDIPKGCDPLTGKSLEREPAIHGPVRERPSLGVKGIKE